MSHLEELFFLLIKCGLPMCIYVYQSVSDLVNVCLCGCLLYAFSSCIHVSVCLEANIHAHAQGWNSHGFCTSGGYNTRWQE